jgi:RNA ligase
MERKKYSIRTLNKYINEGKIEKNPHPTLPISIYNYTRETQFNQDWDEITIAMRGTIIDEHGYVIASSFLKFFNYEEVKEILPKRSDYVYVQEKVDGSLGILFYYDGEWHLATKGSFTSEQSKRGMEILRKKYKFFDQTFMTHITYIVEIIYSENRIVVDYKNKEKIVFLSTSENGYENHWTTSLCIFKGSGIKKADIIKTEQYFEFGEDLYKSLKDKNIHNSEGFVLTFQPYFRMKIKFEDYVRLHRLITGFSNVDIWESLRDGKNIEEMLENVPDEFDKWVRKTISDIRYHKYRIEERCGKIHDYFRYGKYGDRDPEPTKKEFVEHLDFCKTEPKIRAICLSIWDSKKYDKILWGMLRPKYQKPFWQKDDL